MKPTTRARATCTLRQLCYQSIADDRLLERLGRSEPRAVKRRLQKFRLLTKPRREVIIERYRKRRSEQPLRPQFAQRFQAHPFRLCADVLGITARRKTTLDSR